MDEKSKILLLMAGCLNGTETGDSPTATTLIYSERICDAIGDVETELSEVTAGKDSCCR